MKEACLAAQLRSSVGQGERTAKAAGVILSGMADPRGHLHESWEPIVREHRQEAPEGERREALRAAVRERIAEVRQQPTGQPPAATFPQGAPQHIHPQERELRDLEESRQLSFLAHLALEEGIEPAVRLAERVGSPYVLDALHDFIVDRLLDVLKKRRRQS